MTEVKNYLWLEQEPEAQKPQISVGEDQGELPGGGSTELPRQSQQER